MESIFSTYLLEKNKKIVKLNCIFAIKLYHVITATSSSSLNN